VDECVIDGAVLSGDRNAMTLRFSTRKLETIRGEMLTVPDPTRLVHIQLRRFSGCPICNVHIRTFVTRRTEIEAAGVREIIVFYSKVDDVRAFQSELPFDVIADPARALYDELGVGSSPIAFLHPRAFFVAMTQGLPWALRSGNFGGAIGFGENHEGVPGDFLIATDGRIVASKRGVHAADQWSARRVMTL
jgi:hypothetical protein